MDVFDAIRQRRSHRSFLPDSVEKSLIDKILEAGRWAPSPANNQPWDFIVIESAEARGKLVELSERAWNSGSVELHGFSTIRPLPYSDEESQEPAPGYSLSFLNNVPVMIVVVGNPNPAIAPSVSERVSDGYKYACAAAIQNMLLMAHALGLGSLWFTLFDRDQLSSYLKIEAGKHPLAVVCIGRPDESPADPGRFPLESKVRRID